MQFKNLSVAKKIWLLLALVMLLLIGATWGMASYMTQLETTLREHVLEMEGRGKLALRLRGDVEASASTIVAAMFAHDAASRRFFEERFEMGVKEQLQLMQELRQRIQSAEGKASLQKLEQHREVARQIVSKLERERQQGGDIGEVVRQELTPTILAFLKELDAMVELQQYMVQQNLKAGDQQRRQALMLVAGCFAIVILAAVLISHWLVGQLTRPLTHAVELANEIAHGNLNCNVQIDRDDELGALMRALQQMTEKLRNLVGQVRDGVASVSSASSQIEQGNQSLSTRTEATAANLEETAASIEELTATVTQSADTARQANQLAATAVQAAERGGEVVHQVVQSMDQINTSSRKISDIIGVIDGIAFQTNILALNAAVEAARAGEQGRGFAVVAGEVRSLAQRSAEAAKEIKALITTSVNNVDTGAAQVAQAGESMQEIVDSVRRVTDLIGEITASSNEQRDGISQVNQAVNNLDQMTQQNAALVEEASAAASSMNEQAQRLAQVVALFNVGQEQTQRLASPVSAPATHASTAAAPAATRKQESAAKATAPKLSNKSEATSKAAAAPAKPAPIAAKPVQEAAPKLLRPAPLNAASSNKNTVNDDDWETF